MKQHEIDFLIKELVRKDEKPQPINKAEKRIEKLNRKKQRNLSLRIFR